MSGKDKTTGMKSAYELALERMERDGIERPNQEALTDDARAQVAEARSKAEAELANLEILHKQKLAKGHDDIGLLKEEYVRERKRIEERLESKIAKLRAGS